MTEKSFFGFTAPDNAPLDKAFSLLTEFVSQLDQNGKRAVKVYAAIANGAGEILAVLQDKLCSLFIEALGMEQCPALSLVVQRPLAPATGPNASSPLCAEIWSVDKEKCRRENTSVASFLLNGLVHVKIENNETTELWSSGFQSDYGTNKLGSDSCTFATATSAAEKSFERVAGLLRSQGFTFDDIFRQWNYIGHIVDFRGGEQNYQAFNEVRARYYASKEDLGQFPAATGIGMDYEGVCIDFIALRGRDAEPLRSPVQTDAFSYGQTVLVGDAPRKNAPLFERGRRCDTTVMISGTASIRGQETIDKGNAARQLQNTVSFIEELVRHNIKEDARYKRVRLYVKPGMMNKSLEKLLRESYPGTGLISLVEADICRPDLLIEIEADLYSTKR